MALNDLALTAVAHALVHRQQPTFENRVCQRIDVLDGLIAETGGFDELVAFGRRCATQAMAAGSTPAATVNMPSRTVRGRLVVQTRDRARRL